MKRTQIGPFKLSLHQPHVPPELWIAIADPVGYARRREQERWRQVQQQKEREARRGTNPAAAVSAVSAVSAATTTTMEEDEEEEGEGEEKEAQIARLEIDPEDAELLLATLRSRLKLMEALHRRAAGPLKVGGLLCEAEAKAAEDARKPRRQGGVAVGDARWKYVEYYFDGQERVLRTACAFIEAMLAG